MPAFSSNGKRCYLVGQKKSLMMTDRLKIVLPFIASQNLVKFHFSGFETLLFIYEFLIFIIVLNLFARLMFSFNYLNV